MYQNSVLGNFLWRSGAESFAWCTYNILVQGGGGLPPPVGGSVGGRGRQRPPPKETPCSCTSRACTMYIHCTHLPGAMAMCQFKLHIRDNFFSRTLCSKPDFFSFMTISADTKWGDVHLYKIVIDRSMTIFSVMGMGYQGKLSLTDQ